MKETTQNLFTGSEPRLCEQNSMNAAPPSTFITRLKL